MKIGEVSRRSGLPASTIRFYETQGLLPPAPRVRGQRSYGPEALDYLRLVSWARRVGFRMKEVRELVGRLNDDGPQKARMRRAIAGKIRELDQWVDRARTMRRALRAADSCPCLSLADCARFLVGRVSARRGLQSPPGPG